MCGYKKKTEIQKKKKTCTKLFYLPASNLIYIYTYANANV